MRIVVMGGTGLIGSKLVATLCERGHEAVAASHESGVACTGAAVVIDVAEPPYVEDATAIEFFTTCTRNLLEYAAAAGVSHHVALSTVGTERLLDSGYFRARCAQEALIRESGIPHTIVRATQLFESLGSIADAETQGTSVRVPPARIQPIAADDVIRLIAETAVAAPLNGTIEVGGPEPFYLEELLERILGANNDPRRVIVDAHARYFGAEVGKRSLVAGDEAELGGIRFEDWFRVTRYATVPARVPACPSIAHPSSRMNSVSATCFLDRSCCSERWRCSALRAASVPRKPRVHIVPVR